MSFSEAVKDGFDHYVKFEGRASRPAFWWWVLFVIIVSIVCNIIDSAVFDTMVLSWIASVGLFLPNLSVAIRRLHDTDHSGWWILIWFTVIGIIVLLVWYLTKSDPVENKYGPPPPAVPIAA